MFDNMIYDFQIADSLNTAGRTVTYNPNADITAPVYTYWPNSVGVYNIFGNVAEMTSEKGISKGGSWRDKKKEATVQKDYPYNGATAWLGFRCVCVVEWQEVL